ncbi:prenyltransferase/squalene oxidase repeat-containing protein [Streptomyces sp. NRRL S-646]|uniref:prenyltransferase/squalene oxidase repeat-containing protein n=1 Tax=Streptomyces sp. NRRL S-646 TaxID=1463917 RepID=UPI001331AE28|nr:prenyltransferase/squalene oxidase repeat-containing protein [Streptomyces sp. NRRL S-646]
MADNRPQEEPAPALYAAAQRVVDRAVGLAVSQQRADGGWWSLPEPRIFETALCAIVLRELGLAQDTVRRSRRWLSTAEPQDHSAFTREVEGWLRHVVLDPHRRPALPREVAGEHPGRWALIEAVALAAGLTPVPSAPSVASSQWSLGGLPLRKWQRSLSAAAAILVQTSTGRPAAVGAVDTLVRTQRCDGSFDGMPVVTALALWASARAEESGFARAGDVREKAMRWLLSAQEPDGTWRFLAFDVWDTALCLRSMGGHGHLDRDAAGPARRFLEAAQNSDGGWGCTSALESDNDTTAAVLLALAPDGPDPARLASAQAFLLSQQGADGLWSTWQSHDDLPAEDVVAHVVDALHRTGCTGAATGAAVEWLRACHDTRGCWTAQWYSPPAYAAAEIAHVVGCDSLQAQRAYRDLIVSQNRDGGWPARPGSASSPAATGLALSALVRAPQVHRDALARGLAYLVETQHAAGHWDGEPIMAGPRPFLAHPPLHTHAFATGGARAALLALTGPHPVGPARARPPGHSTPWTQPPP